MCLGTSLLLRLFNHVRAVLTGPFTRPSMFAIQRLDVTGVAVMTSSLLGTTYMRLRGRHAWHWFAATSALAGPGGSASASGGDKMCGFGCSSSPTLSLVLRRKRKTANFGLGLADGAAVFGHSHRSELQVAMYHLPCVVVECIQRHA